MTILNLPGRDVTRPELERQSEWQDVDSFGVHVEVLQEQEVIGVVRGEPLVRVKLPDVKEGVDDSDVVELRFDGGVRQYLSVRDLRAESVVVDGEIEVPAVFERGRREAARGLGDWVLRGLRVLRIRPDAAIANLAEDQVVDQFERRLTPSEGLYRVEAAGELTPAGSLDIAAPWLVFIHGTASSTKGSFGDLFGTHEWSLLRKFYDDRVLAWQHRTLSVSPVDNALELAERLPARGRLHLVTHSRGGLIGELLGVSDFDETKALRAFRTRPEEQQKLIRLRDLVRSKQFAIEKFVRVAAPARGTILASKRLDIYLSVILNVVGALPALAEDPLYSLLKATAMELIRRRTDPNRLPGLEAMMPESPLIHFLNQGQGVSSTADLAVIAGDLQGEGFWGRLKAFVTDAFYLEEHDLVVNTAAMFGGVGRKKKAAGVYDRGGAVNHFSYFSNERTRARLHAWLTSAPNAGFSEFDPAQPGINIPALRAGADPRRPLLIIVPDVLGSVLALNLDERPPVWLDVAGLSLHGFETITNFVATSPKPVDGLAGATYQQLVNGFSTTHEVIAFPWDWRKSMTEAVEALEAEIARLRREKGDRRIDLIGHGAGGLIIRRLSAATWDLIQGRALLLATAEKGMFPAVEWCSPRSRLVRMLALADGALEPAEIAASFRGFGAVLELLPDRFLEPETREAAWRRVNVDPPAGDRLDAALQFRKSMPPPRAAMVAVAGRAPETPVDFDDSNQTLQVSTSGDGQVLTESLDPQIARWRVEAAHGDLPAHSGAFSAYLQLLTTGQTKLLSEPQKVTAAFTAKPFVAEPLLFPSNEELVSEAFASRADRAAEEDYPLAVSVTHGDLRVARHPVAVGHHLGDSIVSAEAVLDCQLERRLSRRFHMGIYPASVGSSEVIRDPKKSPPGAIIIGLGQVGGVTAEVVRRGITAAALRHALEVDESRQPGESSWLSAAFTSVIIGTRGGSRLTTVESIAAIIRGAIDANRLLRAQKMWNRVRVDAVELIELYEQRAISAVYAARRAVEDVASDLEAGERVDLVQILRPTPSGQFRMPPEDWETGWWQRMSITLEPPRSDRPDDAANRPFRYLVLTDKARVEARLQCNDRGATSHLIQSGIKTPKFDAEISGALFELLVPNEIKAAADAAPRVVLILDPDTAQIPWEMLADTSRAGRPPQSVRSGMIRQFITSDIRYTPQYADVRNALVIGDTAIDGPVVVDGQRVALPVLHGAQAEGEAVSVILSGAGHQVTKLIRGDAETIQKQLFARQYRILHLAGHGIYNAGKPEESGMLLGSDIYLTACQLRQMRIVPDVVFINCCFLGRIDLPPVGGQPHRLAASVAQELINMGVKAIVAAGWAVDDSAAVTFASTFYDQMLNQRQQFGEAVREAREAVFRKHPSTNTWAAYQCYGNPGFSLADAPEEGVARDGSKFCARREFIDELHSLAAQANALSGEDAKLQKERLVGALTSLKIPEEWHDGELLMRLGFAWRDVGDFRKAIEYLERALRHEEGRLSLEGVEQLGNLHSRVAVEEHFAGRFDERDEHFERAHFYLDLLVRLSPTPERQSLLGSTLKKRAAVVQGEERVSLLSQAAESYGKAAEKQAKPYAFLNHVAVEWARDPATVPDALKTKFAELGAVVKELRKSADFWDRVYTPDYALLQQLLSGNVDVQGLVDEYCAVAQESGTEAQKRSVIEQSEFLAEMLADDRAHLRGALRELADRLREKWAITGGKFE